MTPPLDIAVIDLAMIGSTPEATAKALGVGGSYRYRACRDRCEACEMEASRMAYASGLGASEWAAFIDRVPPCDDCRRISTQRGR